MWLIISLILVITILTGCGAKEEVTKNELETQINNVIDDIFSDLGNNTNYSTSTINDKSLDLPEELYSDDTKLVFQDDDDTYMVFTYSGETITGYSVYVLFDSEALAKVALEEYNKDPDEDVKKVYVDGNKVIIEYDESVYKDLTTSAVKYIYTKVDNKPNQ